MEFNRSHLLSLMFGILIGEAFYMLFLDMGIGDFFFPVWITLLIFIEGTILIKDRIQTGKW